MPQRRRIKVLIETFLRKQLGLKAHTVTKVEETEQFMVVDIDRLGEPTPALRTLPTAVPEGAQRAEGAGMA